MTEPVNYNVDKATAKANFQSNYFLGEDWELTDEDLALVNKVFTEREARDDWERDGVIDEFFRLDSKTNRPITEGFLVLGGDAYFEKEEDAVEYLNNEGIECLTFTEAYEMSEREEINETYFTQWYD